MRKLLEWGIFVAVCLGVFVLAGPTSLGGSTSYVVVDGTSMEPTYHHGDLVIARDRDTYDVGDVITYDAPVGVTYRVIHRITEITDDGYLTRGDNREQLDGWIVPFDAVHGSSALVVPRGGTIVAILRHPPVLVAAFAGWVTLALLTRRERRSAGDDGAGPTDGEVQAAEPPVPASATFGSRLWTAALFAGMGVLGLGAGVLVAHAASLVVDGGTLQAFDLAGPERPPAPDPDPPPPMGVVVTVEWRFFNNGGNPITSLVPSDTVTVRVGDPYEVASEAGLRDGQSYAEVECTTVNVGPPAGDWFGSGSFTAIASGRHLVCLQHRPGGRT